MYARMSTSLLALLLALVSVTSAQERFGSLTGKVADPQGLALPGVTVTVTNNETKRSTVFVTDNEGAYLAQALEPGRYTVKFELSGFVAKEAPNVTVALGATATVNSSLQVGGLTETVQVVAETPLIDLGASTRQRNIPAEQFDVIPKGRSFQSRRHRATVGQHRRARGRLPGERRLGGREQLHGGRRARRQHHQRLPAAGRRVRVPAGSAGQDLGSAGRVRRRARRRHQRRDQVGRQHLQGFALRALLGPAGSDEQRVREAAAYRPGHAEQRVLSCRTTPRRFNRNEFGGLHRRSDHPRPLFFFGVGFARVFEDLTQELHPWRRAKWCRSTRKRTSEQLFGKVSVRAHQPPAVQPVRPLDARPSPTGVDRPRSRRRPANETTASKENLESRRTLG